MNPLILILSTLRGMTAADLCHISSKEISGDWFCQNVDRITYVGVGRAGAYNRVVGMDGTTGECKKESKSISGPMAPLHEDVRECQHSLTSLN